MNLLLKMKTILLLCGLVFWSLALVAQATSTSDQDQVSLFNSGVENYKNADYQKSYDSFKSALKQDPDNITLLTNLGLAAFKIGNSAEAIGYLRKARALQPSFSTPDKALEFILSQFQLKEIPHEIEVYESIRRDFLNDFNLNQFLFMTALCFFSFGWLLIGFFKKRKLSKESEIERPTLSFVLILISILFLVSATLTILKIYDSQVVRGTVIIETATVLSAPSETSVPLYEVFGGHELIIYQETDGWVQIRYPGAAAGWIKKEQVLSYLRSM